MSETKSEALQWREDSNFFRSRNSSVRHDESADYTDYTDLPAKCTSGSAAVFHLIVCEICVICG
jgi:hypothetical protein